MMTPLKETQILLVEDNPDDAELIMRTLQKEQLTQRLLWVKDGAAALEYLFPVSNRIPTEKTGQPRLVLLDLRLPKVNGFEVLKRIKTSPCTRCIPVVVLTSSKEDRDITESYHLGVNSYISKPIEFDVFEAAVTQLGLYWLLLNKPPEACRLMDGARHG